MAGAVWRAGPSELGGTMVTCCPMESALLVGLQLQEGGEPRFQQCDRVRAATLGFRIRTKLVI
jgi:hypothetical protein